MDEMQGTKTPYIQVMIGQINNHLEELENEMMGLFERLDSYYTHKTNIVENENPPKNVHSKFGEELGNIDEKILLFTRFLQYVKSELEL